MAANPRSQHRLVASRAQSMLWLLEECEGLEWSVEKYRRRGNHKLAPEKLKRVHPLGKSPLVTFDLPRGRLVLAESGRTMEYLCDHFATHLVPQRWQEGRKGQLGGETETWMRYRHLMHYAEGSFMPLWTFHFMNRAWNRGCLDAWWLTARRSRTAELNLLQGHHAYRRLQE